MDNKEFLISAGWIEDDGWLCNPKLKNEKVFTLEEVNNQSPQRLLDVISATAVNYGIRWKAKESKERIKSSIMDLAKNVDKWI